VRPRRTPPYIVAMPDYPEIERHKQDLDACVTCGVCQSVCPSFQLSGRELLSPRGRIVLLRRLLEGDITPDQITAEAFDFCTLCYACQTACPAGVRTDLLFIAARKTIADANGIPKAKQLVFKTLEKPNRVELGVTLGSLAQKTLGRKVVNTLAGGMAVPPLRTRAFLRSVDEVLAPYGRKRARVGFFLGCMANYVTDGPARASIEVLRRLGAEVVIPKNQVCCGAPSFNNGDFDTARRLAEVNLRTLKEANVDAIVSPDATCGGAFTHEIPELMAEDEEFGAMAQDIRKKSVDWATFALEGLDAKFPETVAPALQVTVHDSCHLTHTAGTHRNVRTLLERLPGVSVVEMKEATICCGFGGSFSSIYPDEAAQWQRRKIDNMMAAQVPVAIVSSPGCLATLQERQAQDRSDKVRIMHPAELIVERCDWGR